MVVVFKEWVGQFIQGSEEERMIEQIQFYNEDVYSWGYMAAKELGLDNYWVYYMRGKWQDYIEEVYGLRADKCYLFEGMLNLN